VHPRNRREGYPPAPSCMQTSMRYSHRRQKSLQDHLPYHYCRRCTFFKKQKGGIPPHKLEQCQLPHRPKADCRISFIADIIITISRCSCIAVGHPQIAIRRCNCPAVGRCIRPYSVANCCPLRMADCRKIHTPRTSLVHVQIGGCRPHNRGNRGRRSRSRLPSPVRKCRT
jgi:hypothetical protein